MTKLRVLIERIDGRIQHYNIREENLDRYGYTETTQWFRDEPSLVWTKFPEEAAQAEPRGPEEGPGEISIEPNWYEVVVYTEYRQKRRTRSERYELRTVVRAFSTEEAKERGIGKMVRIIPDDHGAYLDALGIYGVDASEAVHQIEPSESYRGVKFHRFNAGGVRPAEPRYTWDREGEE